jgi:hypothetical protein
MKTPIVLALAVLTTSCFVIRETRYGSGIAGSEVRQLSAFDEISVAGSADIEVFVGQGAPSVTLTIDDNLLQHVVTEVDGDTLEIYLDKDFRYDHDVRLKAEITTPELSAVSLAGAGDVDVRGVRAEHFAASIAGSGDMTIVGDTDSLEVSIAGSGAVDTLALRSRRAEVSIAGSGDVLVHASEDLDVSVAGSGDVGYHGHPQVSRSILGSGSVYRKSERDL